MLTASEKSQNLVTLITLIDQDGTLARLQSDHKQRLIDEVLAYLEKESISLFTYAGPYHAILLDSLKLMVAGDRFIDTQVNAALTQFLTKLKALEQDARRRYNEQDREVDALHQLRTVGYIQPGHLLTGKDIQTVLNAYLPDSVNHTDTISLTEDSGATVAAAIQHFERDPKPLLVPINVNANHWIFLIRYQTPEGPKYYASDSAREPLDPTHGNQAKLERALGARVSYVYTGEQSDGHSCGERMAQKALQFAGVRNAFTQVPPKEGGRLRAEFFKLLVETDETLKTETLHVSPGDRPLVYIDPKGRPDPHSHEVISNQKYMQEKSDEYLAISLQEVYRNNPSITDAEAMRIAEENVKKTTYTDFQTKKQDMSAWTKRHFTFKAPTKVFTSCREEARESGDFQDDTSKLGF